MTDHGYRIYVMRAYRDRIKGVDAEPMGATSEARTRLIELLQQLSDGGTIFRDRRQTQIDGVEPLPPVSLTVSDPQIFGADLIHLVVGTGETGSHRKATRRNGKVRKLEEWSPEIDHFVTILLPKDDGDTFLLIAHVYRSRDAAEELVRALVRQDLANKKAELAAQKKARKKAREKKQPVPKFEAPWRLLYERRQAVDNNYLSELIQGAKSATLVFEQFSPSDRGGPPGRARRTLRFALHDDEREVGTKMARRWNSRRQRGEVTSPKDGVSELAAEMFSAHIADEEEFDGYDRASISLRGSAVATIAVDTLKEVFTYPISKNRPLVHTYYSRALERLQLIAREEDIEIAKHDAVEVSRWLEGLTSGPS